MLYHLRAWRNWHTRASQKRILGGSNPLVRTTLSVFVGCVFAILRIARRTSLKQKKRPKGALCFLLNLSFHAKVFLWVQKFVQGSGFLITFLTLFLTAANIADFVGFKINCNKFFVFTQ